MIAQFANTFKLIGSKSDEQDRNAATLLSYDDDHIENNAIISASDDSDPLSYNDDSTLPLSLKLLKMITHQLR